MKSILCSSLLCAVVALVGGCAPGFGIPVGPYPVAIEAGEGVVDPGVLELPIGVRGTVPIEQAVCQLPTEEEVQVLVEESVGEAFSPAFELTEILLTSITLTATSGDFSDVTEVVAYYRPKPVGGIPQEAERFASAQSAGGFEAEISLQPERDVDLLGVIRENDANPDEGCPTIILEITGTFSGQAVEWMATLFGDVYGEVSF